MGYFRFIVGCIFSTSRWLHFLCLWRMSDSIYCYQCFSPWNYCTVPEANTSLQYLPVKCCFIFFSTPKKKKKREEKNPVPIKHFPWAWTLFLTIELLSGLCLALCFRPEEVSVSAWNHPPQPRPLPGPALNTHPHKRCLCQRKLNNRGYEAFLWLWEGPHGLGMPGLIIKSRAQPCASNVSLIPPLWGYFLSYTESFVAMRWMCRTCNSGNTVIN